MPLNKSLLKTNIKQLLSDMRSKEDVSDDEFADKLASAIDGYIKQMTITYVAGLVAPSGPVTGSAQFNIS